MFRKLFSDNISLKVHVYIFFNNLEKCRRINEINNLTRKIRLQRYGAKNVLDHKLLPIFTPSPRDYT